MQTTDIHPKLQTLIEVEPVVRAMFKTDLDYTISNRTEILFYSPSKRLESLQNLKGYKLKPSDPMSKILTTRKPLWEDIPATRYGTPLRSVSIPIFDYNGKDIIGSIALGISLQDQANILMVAENFAATSEQITASTHELEASSENLQKYVQTLNESQTEMLKQVESSSKILDLINSISRNTRILGFNAGIEAARAGDAGKGFSVVAKEITKLADQSAESVNEIRKLLEALYLKVQSIEKVVEDATVISVKQTHSTSEILQALQGLSTVAVQIEDLAKKL